jgi:hypothetical protein
MKVSLTVLALAALLALCAAQAGTKLEGSWKRTACACVSPLPGGACDDIWLTEYPNVRYGQASLGAGCGNGWCAIDPGTPPTRPFYFYRTGGEFALSANVAQSVYDCHGVMGRQMICETQGNRSQEFCRVTFECTDGDCIAAVATWNMRSIMFPIVGFLLSLAWLLMAFLKGLPVDTISMAVAILIWFFGLFLLVSANVFPALMAMAFAALSLLASRNKGGWELKLAVIAGIWVFLTFAGLNGLAGGGGNYFDNTMGSYINEGCFVYFGIELKSQRCAQYLLFTGFLGFLIMMLTPLLVYMLIMAMNNKGAEK